MKTTTHIREGANMNGIRGNQHKCMSAVGPVMLTVAVAAARPNAADASAVRSGGITSVPVPAALSLFGSGLLGLIGMFRRKMRHRSTKRAAGCVCLIMSALACEAAMAAPIPMPAGSRVWMMLTSNACDMDGDSDCTASNQLGVNPPNGIPLSTFSEPGGAYVRGAAEVLPHQIRSSVEANTGSFMYISMFDSYTVHGTAPGPFEITVHFGVDGTANSILGASYHLLQGTVSLEVGTWSSSTEPTFHEQFRVNPFDPVNTASQTVPMQSSRVASISNPINVATSYSRTVSPGEIFDIAYGMTTGVTYGEFDLFHTAAISFDLPNGVYLTSALGGTFGAPVPVLPAVWLFGSGLIGLVGAAQIGDRVKCSHYKHGRTI